MNTEATAEDVAQATAAVEGAEVPAPTKAKTPKTPVPEGYVAPVKLADEVSAKLGEKIPPQQIYGYVKNDAGLPTLDRGEGVVPRIVVEYPAGVEYLVSKINESRAKRAARQAAKASQAPAEQTETPPSA
jgi:hypothetical protein